MYTECFYVGWEFRSEQKTILREKHQNMQTFKISFYSYLNKNQ